MKSFWQIVACSYLLAGVVVASPLEQVAQDSICTSVVISSVPDCPRNPFVSWLQSVSFFGGGQVQAVALFPLSMKTKILHLRSWWHQWRHTCKNSRTFGLHYRTAGWCRAWRYWCRCTRWCRLWEPRCLVRIKPRRDFVRRARFDRRSTPPSRVSKWKPICCSLVDAWCCRRGSA